MAASDVVALLLELIDKHGGKLAGSRCIQVLQKKSSVMRSVIDNAGGLKKFCSQHLGLEFVTVANSDGFIQRRVSGRDVLAPGSSLTVLATLLALIDEHGGKISASQVVPALRERCANFERLVGGLKKFCASQPELEFVAMKRGNGDFIQRRIKQSVKPPMLASSVAPVLRLSNFTTPSTSSASSGASSSSSCEGSSDGEESISESMRLGDDSVANAMRCKIYLGNEQTMYHATTASNAASIVRTGEFRPGKGGYLGPGIYFCQDPKTAMRRAQPKSSGKRVLASVVLEFQVQMGHMQTAAEKTAWTEEIVIDAYYHSMKAHGKSNDCYMIPNNSRGQIDMGTIRIYGR